MPITLNTKQRALLDELVAGVAFRDDQDRAAFQEEVRMRVAAALHRYDPLRPNWVSSDLRERLVEMMEVVASDEDEIDQDAVARDDGLLVDFARRFAGETPDWDALTTAELVEMSMVLEQPSVVAHLEAAGYPVTKLLSSVGEAMDHAATQSGPSLTY